MTKPISLVVTDSGPMITLALAMELDLLIAKDGIRVFVPDIVKFELLRYMEKPGTKDILDWIKKHEGTKVFVPSTQVYAEFQAVLKEFPQAKSRSRGEEAATEVLEKEMHEGDTIGILVFEDGDLRKNTYLVRVPDNVLMLSTAQFLSGLEKENIIESASDILDRVTESRGQQVKEQHMQSTPGAEDREDEGYEDFAP